MVDAMRGRQHPETRTAEPPRTDGAVGRRAAIILGGALMAGDAAAASASLYDFRMEAIEGGPLELAAWRGKPVLVVNTASFCGYTSPLTKSRSTSQTTSYRVQRSCLTTT